MSAHWAMGENRMGFTTIYVVDEHGCLLNTEPACTVPERYGNWFLAWLLAQPCPHPTTPALQEHRPSFPAPSAAARERERERLAAIERNSYLCGLCGRRTFHANDVVNGYCPCCGSADGSLPKTCEHRPAPTGDSERSQLVAAVLELELLLGHLRSCAACYDGYPCLDKHFLVKRIQGSTEAARNLARMLAAISGQVGSDDRG